MSMIETVAMAVGLLALGIAALGVWYTNIRRVNRLREMIADLGGREAAENEIGDGFVKTTSFSAMDIRSGFILNDMRLLTYEGALSGVASISVRQTVFSMPMTFETGFILSRLSTPKRFISEGFDRVSPGLVGDNNVDLYVESGAEYEAVMAVIETIFPLIKYDYNISYFDGEVYIYRHGREISPRSLESSIATAKSIFDDIRQSWAGRL